MIRKVPIMAITGNGLRFTYVAVANPDSAQEQIISKQMQRYPAVTDVINFRKTYLRNSQPIPAYEIRVWNKDSGTYVRDDVAHAQAEGGRESVISNRNERQGKPAGKQSSVNRELIQQLKDVAVSSQSLATLERGGELSDEAIGDWSQQVFTVFQTLGYTKTQMREMLNHAFAETHAQ